jgi:Amt family ammonium transporter
MLSFISPAISTIQAQPDPTGAKTGTALDVPANKPGEPTIFELAETVGHNRIAENIMWTLITGFLVMFMQAGFAMVETGFTRAKNVPTLWDEFYDLRYRGARILDMRFCFNVRRCLRNC